MFRSAALACALSFVAACSTTTAVGGGTEPDAAILGLDAAAASGGPAEGDLPCTTESNSEAAFVPFFDRDTLRGVDTEYRLRGDDTVGALDTASAWNPTTRTLRATVTGMVQVNHDHPSTLLSFTDTPIGPLRPDDVVLLADGQPVPASRLTCTRGDTESLDLVFLIDVTGSMQPIIAAVRDSLLDFVDEAVALGVAGRVGVVTYQDTVGVQVGFDTCPEPHLPERSPFFPPVSLDDADGVEALRAFIGGLRADQGSDLSENLAAAVDFAAHNVIGLDERGAPNVIGEGNDDPPYTQPWPAAERKGLRVLVPVTDATFHNPAARETSVRPDFRARPMRDILGSLGDTVVGVIDPALVNAEDSLDIALDTDEDDLDADIFAAFTGGFGVDRSQITAFGITESVSFFDLELLAFGRGLVDIPLAPVLASTCVIEGTVDAPPEETSVQVTVGGHTVVFRSRTRSLAEAR